MDIKYKILSVAGVAIVGIYLGAFEFVDSKDDTEALKKLKTFIDIHSHSEAAIDIALAEACIDVRRIYGELSIKAQARPSEAGKFQQDLETGKKLIDVYCGALY